MIIDDIHRFYAILQRMEKSLGGKKILSQCNGRMNWPQRGVYFFFGDGEIRSGSGSGMRVVRVGTHGLKKGSYSTLWGRLRQHKGFVNGGGNHRGSVFRLHIGKALIKNGDWPDGIRKTWGKGSSANRELRQVEIPLEKAVSNYIGEMPFLWLSVPDAPGPDSQRAYIEKNSIALLSNYCKPVDPPSKGWLGSSSDHESITKSGLWNINHVGEKYEPGFLDIVEKLIF
jgi:hypothetical protein